ETRPIEIDAFHSRLNWGTSTSAPARKVKMMPANEPMKVSHDGTSIEKALPTTKPPNSSISATERPISTETVDASRIVPASSAAIAMSLISTSGDQNVRGRGHQPLLVGTQRGG